MNRRDLVKFAAGVTAASYGRILGANDRAGMALIGSGRRGREVMSAFIQSDRADLRVICDVYEEQRKTARQQLKPAGEAPFECVAHEEALARRDVDAVLIGTPDHLHVDLAAAALAAGKHVYLEKPTTHKFDEQHKLRKAVKASGKVLQTGMQQRSGLHYMKAKEEIFAKNRLGKIVLVRTSWSNFPWQTRLIAKEPKPANLDWERFLGPAPKRPYEKVRYDSWRYFPHYGGGVLADILTHWADVAQWMMDEPVPATAAAAGGIYHLNDGRENPDTVNAMLQYKSGWNLTFESSVLPLQDRPTVLFLGTEGSLDISRGGYTFKPNKGEAETVRNTGNLELAHVNNFLDAIYKGAKLNADAEIGIQACNPVHLAKAAYWKKQFLKWENLS